jgi:hypothetical protein
VRAEAEFRRLHALGHETFDRPGVDEDPHRLFGFGALRVALGDVDALDADALHQPRPVLAALRLLVRDAGVAGDVEQRLLDEPRHHARVGAAAGDRGRPARILAPRGQRRFAQREVGPGRGPLGGVE